MIRSNQFYCLKSGFGNQNYICFDYKNEKMSNIRKCSINEAARFRNLISAENCREYILEASNDDFAIDPIDTIMNCGWKKAISVLKDELDIKKIAIQYIELEKI